MSVIWTLMAMAASCLSIAKPYIADTLVGAVLIYLAVLYIILALRS